MTLIGTLNRRLRRDSIAITICWLFHAILHWNLKRFSSRRKLNLIPHYLNHCCFDGSIFHRIVQPIHVYLTQSKFRRILLEYSFSSRCKTKDSSQKPILTYIELENFIFSLVNKVLKWITFPLITLNRTERYISNLFINAFPLYPVSSQKFIFQLFYYDYCFTSISDFVYGPPAFLFKFSYWKLVILYLEMGSPKLECKRKKNFNYFMSLYGPNMIKSSKLVSFWKFKGQSYYPGAKWTDIWKMAGLSVNEATPNLFDIALE